MLAYTTPEQVAIEGNECQVETQILITLPGGIYPDISLAIESGGCNISMTTDAPAGTGRPSGSAVRQLTFTVSGMVDPTDETKTAFWLFNPANSASPLYRASRKNIPVARNDGITIAGASSPQWFPKGQFLTDDIQVNPDGTVVFTCLDYRSKLRGTVNLPAVITVAPYNAGLTSEYAIDAILRAATNTTISSWRPQRADCIFACGFRTSLWAEVGTLDTTYSQPVPTFAPGVNGSALASVSSANTPLNVPVWAVEAPVVANVFMRFVAQGITTSTGGPSITLGKFSTIVGPPNRYTMAGMSLTITSTGVTFADVNAGSSTTVSVAIDSGPHVVAVSVAYAGSSYSGTIRIDGVSHTFSGLAAGFGPSSYGYVSALPGPNGGTMEDATVTTEASPTFDDTFTPGAVLDASLNSLQITPAISGDPWTAIQAALDAESAAGWFDVNGIFRTYNRRTLSGGTASRTVSSASSLKDAQIETAGAASGQYNHITVPCQGWAFSARQTVWSMATVQSVPANQSISQVVAVDTSNGLIAGLATSDSGRLPNGSTNTSGLTYWRAATDASGLSEVATGVTVTVSDPTSTGFTLTVTNLNPFPVWLVSPADYTDLTTGTACVQVGGILVTQGDALVADAQWPPLVEGGAASAPQGDVTYPWDSSDWLQLLATAQILADDTLADLNDEIPMINNVAITPDPRLDIGDIVTLVDTEVFGFNDPAVIFSFTDTFGAGNYGQTLGLQLIAKFGFMIWDLTGRCEWDTNTYV